MDIYHEMSTAININTSGASPLPVIQYGTARTRHRNSIQRQKRNESLDVFLFIFDLNSRRNMVTINIKLYLYEWSINLCYVKAGELNSDSDKGP